MVSDVLCAADPRDLYAHAVMVISRRLVNHHATPDGTPLQGDTQLWMTIIRNQTRRNTGLPRLIHTHINTVMGTAIILRDTQDY